MSSTVSNAIILLDLIQAGLTITNEINQLFRKAESEGRNVTHAELQELAEENDELFAEVMSKL